MFEVYPWQETFWQKWVTRTRHAHAYLLHGAEGIGKRALANRLAAFMLCQTPQPLAACGQCRTCLLLKAGTHPDLYELQPEEAGKAIRVDDVRDTVSFVTQTAQFGGRKLVIIDPAEAMNINAANALLKSLEEPAGDTVFILVSHQISLLLPTIRSRCQLLAAPMPTNSESIKWLRTKLTSSNEEELKQLLALATSAPLKAVKFQQEGVPAHYQQAVDGFKRLLRREMLPCEVVELWKSIDLLLLLDWFYGWTLSITRARVMGRSVLPEDNMRKVIEYLLDHASISSVLELQDELLEYRMNVINRANLNRQLLLESLLMKWIKLTLKNSVNN